MDPKELNNVLLYYTFVGVCCIFLLNPVIAAFWAEVSLKTEDKHICEGTSGVWRPIR